jgi:hypothetical protein
MSNIPLLFNTMPKSGSVYIGNTLANGLGRKWSAEAVAQGFFPNYYLIPNKLAALTLSGDVRQEHFDISPINLRVLAKHTDRLVLNVRDPRQATLSWAHHAARLAREHPGTINYTQDDPPAGLFDRPFSEQVDYHLAIHQSFLTSWCRDWVTAADDKNCPVRILILCYEQFIADPIAYCREVASWWGFDPDEFVYQNLDKTIALNFRKGEADEWRGVFSPRQRTIAADAIGPELMERFGWKP